MSIDEESHSADEEKKPKILFNPFDDIFGSIPKASGPRRRARSAMRSMFADIGDPLDLPCHRLGASEKSDESASSETEAD